MWEVSILQPRQVALIVEEYFAEMQAAEQSSTPWWTAQKRTKPQVCGITIDINVSNCYNVSIHVDGGTTLKNLISTEFFTFPFHVSETLYINTAEMLK